MKEFSLPKCIADISTSFDGNGGRGPESVGRFPKAAKARLLEVACVGEQRSLSRMQGEKPCLRSSELHF